MRFLQTRGGRSVLLLLTLAFVSLAAVISPPAFGQVPAFQRTLEVNVKDPVVLNVAVSRGNVVIRYSHEGQVSIYASGKDAAGKNLSEEFFKNQLLIEQIENQITVRQAANVASADGPLSILYAINYHIDVPFRTQVHSSVFDVGNQQLVGVSGPATLASGAGDIDATYVTRDLLQATTGKGNISCSRVLRVNAETGEGNITLMEDGPSKAVVKNGRGKIEVGGARGSFEGSTDAGMLHIKAVLHDNWHLNSASGTVRVELPPKSSFEVDAGTLSGEIAIERQDMEKPETEARQVHQQVNGGGKRIEIRSVKGTIFIE